MIKSSFPIGMPFISFSCLVAQARTFNTMLNNGGVSGHPCLVCDHRENTLIFSPFNMISAEDLYIWPLLY